MATKTEVLALAATSNPRFGVTSDTGESFVIPPNAAGSLAKFAAPASIVSSLLSLTLVGDATNDVKAYALDEWAVDNVIDANCCSLTI